jgi:hypothetical protein
VAFFISVRLLSLSSACSSPGRLARKLARGFASVPVERLQILQAAFIAAPESFTFIHAGVTSVPGAPSFFFAIQ